METPASRRQRATPSTFKKTTPSVAEVAEELQARLRAMGDPGRARGVQQYFKQRITALGITAPELRLFMRERLSGLREVWSVREAIQLCDFLLRAPEIEIRGAGLLALAAFRKALTPDLLPKAEAWLHQRLDNWALVDSFCSVALSPLLERHPEVEATLARWSAAKTLWPRRAALVTLVPLARRGQRLELAYRLALSHFADPEDLLHKATGWLLREAGKTDPERLQRFLLQHGPDLPRTALRYAIERFPPTVRADLLLVTRKATGGLRRGSGPLGPGTSASTESGGERGSRAEVRVESKAAPQRTHAKTLARRR